MTSEVPQGVKGSVGKWSRSGMERPWDAGDVSELLEVVFAQHCEWTNCHRIIHFQIIFYIM